MTFRTAGVLLLVACGGDASDSPGDKDTTSDEADADTDADTDSDTDADADADTDTDTDTDSGSTAATGDTGATTVPTVETWTGTLHVEADDIGFVVNHDTCDVPITFTLDPALVPSFTGGTSCTFTGALNGQTFEIAFEATPPGAGMFVGDAVVTWPAVGYPLADPWDGRYDAADTISGLSAGHWQPGGGSQAFDWSATFTVVRM